MLRVIYCGKCYETLQERNEFFFRLYEFFCTYYLFTGDFFERKLIREDDSGLIPYALDSLEQIGFIVSTESGGDTLKIKPLGHSMSVFGDHLFCIDDTHHYS